MLGIVGGAATTAGVSVSLATASRPTHTDIAVAAAREYSTKNRLQEVIQALAGELLVELARRGYANTDSPSDFPLGDVKTVEEYVDSERGTYVAATAPKGNPRVRVQTKRTLADGRTLELIVRPTSERSRATISSNDGEILQNLVERAEGDTVGTLMDCEVCNGEYKCGVECNPYGECSCVEYYVVGSCTDPDCIGCHTVDYNCTCAGSDYEC